MATDGKDGNVEDLFRGGRIRREAAYWGYVGMARNKFFFSFFSLFFSAQVLFFLRHGGGVWRRGILFQWERYGAVAKHVEASHDGLCEWKSCKWMEEAGNWVKDGQMGNCCKENFKLASGAFTKMYAMFRSKVNVKTCGVFINHYIYLVILTPSSTSADLP
ncbi:hypothetical protein V8C37DRAFT_374678 [Trichoderma ceciliae]